MILKTVVNYIFISKDGGSGTVVSTIHFRAAKSGQGDLPAPPARSACLQEQQQAADLVCMQ